MLGDALLATGPAAANILCSHANRRGFDPMT
jgi:hypothetical protein